MMKINKRINLPILMLIMISTVGCNEFLDKEPYTPSPTSFFNSVEQLDAYAIRRYGLLSVTSGYNLDANTVRDNNTDNQVGTSGGSRWMPGEVKVSISDNWAWKDLYDINYFFQHVMPKYDADEISGGKPLVDHYVGEMYFFRAYAHYSKLTSIGDSPIVLEAPVDQKESLLELSIRQPRNMLARQILKDLDLAIGLLQDKHDGGSNRLSKNAAHLFKSRVALYEASWERNFRGTAFVPNGNGWPGKEAHPSFAYDADVEINFFLDEAMKSAKIVADAITLTSNPSAYDYTKNDGSGYNPYFEMFATQGQGLKSVNEVLLFKAYDKSIGVSHNGPNYVKSGGGTSYTHQYMENFLMSNGLPIYAQGSGYQGDVFVKDMKINRDSRFQLFVQAPGEILNNDPYIVLQPDILGAQLAVNPTGYQIKKGAAIDGTEWLSDASGTTGSIIFLGVEAHLNYIEACYLKTGSIDGTADGYWKDIRGRANMDEDYMKTVNATEMDKEAVNDLAAYTAGRLVSALEYSIRRERRSEFISGGLRWHDLLRYRAMDQLISEQVFVPQGINLWTETYKIDSDRYFDKNDKTLFIQPPTAKANISKNEDFRTARGNVLKEGKYLYPLRKNSTNLYFDGYKWAAAHYLYPIGSSHLLDATVADNSGEFDVSTSKIYQNPGWGVISGSIATPIVGFQ